MIFCQRGCDSKYLCCDECSLKSREVFTDFVRCLAHFNDWREISITFKRSDNGDIVFVSKNDEGDVV